MTQILEARGFRITGNALALRMCRIGYRISGSATHIVSEARMAAFECTKNYSPLMATCNARRRIGSPRAEVR
jgi:hypothetical protein